jgi:hypothetical protein
VIISSTEAYFQFLSLRYFTQFTQFICLNSLTCPEKFDSERGFTLDWGAKRPEKLKLHKYAIRILRQASVAMNDITVDLSGKLQSHQPDILLSCIFPFILNTVYSSPATFHRLALETGADLYQGVARN